MFVHTLEVIDPIDALQRLSGLPMPCLFDSAMVHPTLGRFSFLAVDPFSVFEVRDGQAFWNGAPVGAAGGRSALAVLKERLAAYRAEPVAGLPPFQGGAAGFFAYDFGRALERLAAPETPEPAVPQVRLGFYDVVLAWDHRENTTVLMSTGWPETDPALRAQRARARADALLSRLARPAPVAAGIRGGSVPDFRSNFERADYETAIARTVAYILAGDIFQANIAQRWSAPLPDGFDRLGFYRALRRANPATFAAFLDHGDLALASSSPERFAQVYEGRVETRPIKGTIRRSADPLEDRRLAEALLASEKDRAENTMIVDLLRNDLSRVCRPHSVHVPVLNGLETYASVHHLVSVVCGVLKDGLDVTDLLGAAFPGGSITGAPKIRAMEIITEVEKVARGVYCGSIGYLGFEGASDLNIAIRTVTLTEDRAIVHAGGGITALSDPAGEYRETLVKARRVLEAFGAALPEDGR